MRLSKKVLLFSVFLFIALLNLRIGKVIMGFDNSSPFFDATSTLSRIFTTDNFFHYGGMLFSPALMLSLLGIPPWINSYLTYFGAMVVGMFFTTLIVLENIDKKKSIESFRAAVLASLGNLVPIWAFSIPILIFAPSFAGVPALIYLLIYTPTGTKLHRYFIGVLLVLGIYYFYSTSINVAAFFLYFIQVVILATVISKSQSTKTVYKRAALVGFIWIAIVQGLLIFKPTQPFILSEAINYGKSLELDTKSREVTTSLFRMEQQRNSFINVTRFATGWISLTDAEDTFMFKHKELVDSLLGIVIGMIPVILVISYVILNNSKLSSTERKLFYLWVVAVFISSSYALIFTKSIPYLGIVLRWVSSKLWPLLFIPFVYLFVNASANSSVGNTLLKKAALLCIGIISLSWTLGIVNKHQQVEFPSEYQTVFGKFNKNDSVVYLPEPNRLYMRQYQWNYYGSGFLTYLTTARILDNGSFHPEQNIYNTLVTDFKSCNLEALRQEVTHIVIDNSTISGEVAIPVCYDTLTTERTGNLTVIKL